MIEVAVPSSKSITQRALILAALSDQPTELEAPLDCDDSRVLVDALRALGVLIGIGDDTWTVTPPARLASPTIHPTSLGNAGTAVRFLSGLAPLLPGPLCIDGDAAMRRRPMGGLLSALNQLGVEVIELGKPNCPPLLLRPLPNAEPPDEVVLHEVKSSQELSALLMMGCRLPRGLRVRLTGSMPSWPYVELTFRAMAAFGVVVQTGDADTLTVPPVVPRAERFHVEGDWSSASYPLAAGWLTDREVRVTNTSTESVQGDRVFPRLLEKLSRPGPRIFTMNDTPDLVPTVVACALFAEGATEITGVAHLRIKESDRLAVLVRETQKLGAKIREMPDGLMVEPAALRGGAQLDPANDHRMAMAFGLISLRVDGLSVLNPDCVSKSYPDFWTMLARFR